MEEIGKAVKRKDSVFHLWMAFPLLWNCFELNGQIALKKK